MFWSDTSSGPLADSETAPGAGPVDESEPEAPSGDYQQADTAEADPVATDEEFLAAMAAEFDAIEAALVRLDDGTFDSCQVCGGSIGQDRLMGDPLLTRCPAHT